ncbi:hypothetical protein NLX98_27725 (plasmid) [Klebsiella quasipneumoniae]|uniref:hypothetical protein n=1 Tax=Klebsiella TaxID=570 RepID=UPI0021B03103|nr:MULTISPECIES: hypothetical protein [Klebsiella]MDS0275803.1 hypothetical protein [Klebsiella quasipneumoniae]UVN19538.1 hypothetical protein [Klebsiella michiganensis]
MTNKDVSKAISVKDKEALHLEVVDGKLAVKRICEDFVIVNLNDIPSNREELIHFNNKYLAPNGLGIDAGRDRERFLSSTRKFDRLIRV